jgi:hypothetical protein
VVLAFRFFYVIGPVFAVWAVILAAIGFTRPEFPRKLGAQRVVILISLALMLTVVLSSMIGAKFEKTERHEAGAAKEKPAGGG